jgi:chloride channel protein, CIC family
MPTRMSSLLRLTLASCIGGCLIGLIGGGFRHLLVLADQLREFLAPQFHQWGVLGLVALVAVTAFCAGLARWLVVRFAPVAAGSGVQHVEAVMRGEAEPVGPEVIPVKFVGGLLAIGSGLALGREGPTVQMGAALGTLCARFLPGAADRRMLNAAGAGAGLAVAFNAPIGGVTFVFEELALGFTTAGVTATLAASVTAIAVMRILLGDPQEFAAGLPVAQPVWQDLFYLVLGAALGLAGALNNVLTQGVLYLADRWRPGPSIFWAAAIGGLIGLVAWFWPAIVGGGETLMPSLLTRNAPIAPVAAILLARFLIGPFCFGAGTPGGIFAPLLVVGAAFGALFAGLTNVLLPSAGLSTVAFAVVGMAAFFTAVVRAPLTGMVLAIEMTGRPDLVLAMLTASLASILTATACGSDPIYESLRKRMLADDSWSYWSRRHARKALLAQAPAGGAG